MASTEIVSGCHACAAFSFAGAFDEPRCNIACERLVDLGIPEEMTGSQPEIVPERCPLRAGPVTLRLRRVKPETKSTATSRAMRAKAASGECCRAGHAVGDVWERFIKWKGEMVQVTVTEVMPHNSYYGCRLKFGRDHYTRTPSAMERHGWRRVSTSTGGGL